MTDEGNITDAEVAAAISAARDAWPDTFINTRAMHVRKAILALTPRAPL